MLITSSAPIRGGVGELSGRGRCIPGYKLQQRQIASCKLEFFCENLRLCNKILLPQQVVQIQSDLIFLQLVAATKFCCGDKDFHKHFSRHTKRFVVATCRRDVLLQLVAYCVPTLLVSML